MYSASGLYLLNVCVGDIVKRKSVTVATAVHEGTVTEKGFMFVKQSSFVSRALFTGHGC